MGSAADVALGSTEAARVRWGHQPQLGLAGLVVVGALSALLAVGFGGPRTSLQLIGPLSTYALPIVVTIALWWDGWPGARWRGPQVGLVNTAIVVAAAVALTMLGQVVVARPDPVALFTARPGAGHLPLYPALLPLAATAFVTFLQFTLVCEKWPCDRFGPLAGGVATLALSWGIAVVVYLTLTNLDGTAPELFAATGLRDPGGPVAALDLAAWLVALTMWQVLVIVGLGGWPFSAIRRRGARLLAANAGTLALGTGTFLALRHGLGWTGPRLTALGGCTVAASLLVTVLLDGWPGPGVSTKRGVATTFAVIAGLVVALDVGLTALGQAFGPWTTPVVEEWVTLTALNFIPGSVVIHVGHWRRWPLSGAPTPA